MCHKGTGLFTSVKLWAVWGTSLGSLGNHCSLMFKLKGIYGSTLGRPISIYRLTAFCTSCLQFFIVLKYFSGKKMTPKIATELKTFSLIGLYMQQDERSICCQYRTSKNTSNYYNKTPISFWARTISSSGKGKGNWWHGPSVQGWDAAIQSVI